MSWKPLSSKRVMAAAVPAAVSEGAAGAAAEPSAVAESASAGASSAVAISAAAPAEASSAVAEHVYSWEKVTLIAREQAAGGQKQPWNRNNAALKYFRDVGEESPGVVRDNYDPEPLDLDFMYEIEEPVHAEQGTDFSFAGPSPSTVQWSPAQFLSSMREDTWATWGWWSMGLCVWSSSGSTRWTVCGCWRRARPKSPSQTT